MEHGAAKQRAKGQAVRARSGEQIRKMENGKLKAES
jgi:hypothetical protein